MTDSQRCQKLILGLTFCGLLAGCSAPEPGQSVLPSMTATRLTWGDLVPLGWPDKDPLAGVDISQLDDEDPRAQALYSQLQAFLDQAPLVDSWHGQHIRLPGYVAPLSFEGPDNRISEFLLVPFAGACIHVPPPARNQIVLVSAPTSSLPAEHDLSAPVWVTGALETTPRDTSLAVAGYTLTAFSVQPYTEDF